MNFLQLNTPLALVAASGLLSAAAIGQQKSPPITVQSNRTNNTLEVAQMETTTQRIANLKVPAGFTVTKFAEM